MASLTVQPSINDVRGQALLQLTQRLGALDLSPTLVYRLDSAPDSSLLLLAWQFDMLAPQWQLGSSSGESIDALTDIDSLTDIDTLSSTADAAGVSDYTSLRTLLGAAIPLHRTRGTPYAIKTALAALGWNEVTLQEGQASWGGSQYPTSEGWAVFRVVINQINQPVGAGDPARIIAAVNFFKPVRAYLDSLWLNLAGVKDFTPVPLDTVVSIFKQNDNAPAPTDQISAMAWPVADSKSIMPTYAKHFYHAGITYGANEPVVADSGVVVQGAAISANG
ncbi:MAG TPA: phage tail protein [Candidatus Binataceae bacterium]|nr:phage tail protein [Candidatus Binataceae bacterium]